MTTMDRRATRIRPDRPTGPMVVGRAAEIGLLSRVLDATGPRVCFVYGIAGIGKSSLLAQFRAICEERGVRVVAIDCRATEPTEQGFLDALRRADPLWDRQDDDRPTVLLVDTYEVFRIADPWLRNELLPLLGATARVIVAGREPPMLEWAVERGRYGGEGAAGGFQDGPGEYEEEDDSDGGGYQGPVYRGGGAGSAGGLWLLEVHIPDDAEVVEGGDRTV